MTDILVRPQKLRQTAQQLRASAKKISGATGDVGKVVLGSALRLVFTGNRASALMKRYLSKAGELAAFDDLVMKFANDLEQAANRFEQADKQSVGARSGIPVPFPVPTPEKGTGLPSNWDTISQFAKPEKGITPELIAAVLKYEKDHRDFTDGVADLEARFIMWYEGWVEDLEVALLNTTLGLAGESFDKISFGAAQMNPEVVRELVEKGYISKPDNWDDDQRDAILTVLLDESKAPMLVAARLEQIYDHWLAGGVDISNRPDVLGNLYGMGLEGKKGVHDNLDDNQGPRGEEIQQTVSDFADIAKTI